MFSFQLGADGVDRCHTRGSQSQYPERDGIAVRPPIDTHIGKRGIIRIGVGRIAGIAATIAMTGRAALQMEIVICRIDKKWAGIGDAAVGQRMLIQGGDPVRAIVVIGVIGQLGQIRCGGDRRAVAGKNIIGNEAIRIGAECRAVFIEGIVDNGGAR